MAIKNLFDYATKELSQDAFLRWLFENYKCDVEGVRKVCYKVLKIFMGFEINEGDIIDLKTFAQDFNIDIMVSLTIETSRKKQYHIIAIEDKTTSGEHNQLEVYNDELDKLRDRKRYHNDVLESVRFHKVFYKTDMEDEDEIKRVKKAKWIYFYIDEIYKKIFEEFTVNGEVIPTGSEILDQYINRVCFLYNNLNNISSNPVKEWDRINFRTYFMKELKPYCERVAEKRSVQLMAKEWSWQGRYISLGITHGFKITNNYYPCIKFSMEIKATDYGDDIGISLRVSRLVRDEKEKEKEVLLEDADPIRAGMKSIIENMDASSGFNLFKMMNQKACVATGSKELHQKLSYDQDIGVIDKYIKESIDSFIEICSYSYEEIRKQDVPEYNEPDFNYIIIKVRKGYVENDTKENRNAKNSRYNVTRRCWVIAEFRRNTDNYKYVLSVSNGIVYEVYEIKEWKKAEGTDNRYEFDGVVAPWKVRNHFLGKLIPEKYRKKGLASPLLFYDAQSQKEEQEDQN